MPQTVEDWQLIERDFRLKWNFPHCIGALDGKHVNIFAPPNTGSTFFNYKKTFSIVLMGLADASYKFIYINVGCVGRISDGGVFGQSSLYSAIENGTLNIPAPKPLIPNDNSTLAPHVIVADDAFALSHYLMKPFAFRNQNIDERIFNYRLSRARRVIENVFGIMSSKFRVMRRTMYLDEVKASKVVLAVCALHNMLMSQEKDLYAPLGSYDTETADGEIIPGAWRQDIADNSQVSDATNDTNDTTNDLNETNSTPKEIREIFKNYFMSGEGAVHWQNKMI